MGLAKFFRFGLTSILIMFHCSLGPDAPLLAEPEPTPTDRAHIIDTTPQVYESRKGEIAKEGKAFDLHTGVLNGWKADESLIQNITSQSLNRTELLKLQSPTKLYPSNQGNDLTWRGTQPKIDVAWRDVELLFRATSDEESADAADKAFRILLSRDGNSIRLPDSQDPKCKGGFELNYSPTPTKYEQSIYWCEGTTLGMLIATPTLDERDAGRALLLCPRSIKDGKIISGRAQLVYNHLHPQGLITDVKANADAKLATGSDLGYISGAIRSGGSLPPAIKAVDEMLAPNPEVEINYQSDRTQIAELKTIDTESSNIFAALEVSVVQKYLNGATRLTEYLEVIALLKTEPQLEREFELFKFNRTFSLSTGLGPCWALLYRATGKNIFNYKMSPLSEE